MKMKRNNIKNLFGWMLPAILLGASSLFVACDDEISGTVVDMPEHIEWDTTDIGKYVHKNFTEPYNIRVIYRWEDGRHDMSKYLVPVKEEKVIPFLEMLKRVWMEPYIKVTTDGGNPDFFKNYVPKEILMCGSMAVNSDGTVTLGQAESGRQILLYNVNNLTPVDTANFVAFIHTMHHEFAHILQQTNKDYDTQYRALSKGGYTSSWMNISNDAAREKGFITAYSQADVNEDFVEMLSVRLVNSPLGWDFLLNRIENEEARETLLKKEEIMKDYMLSVWGIDVDQFRSMVHETIRQEIGYSEGHSFVFDGNYIIADIINGEVIEK